MIDAAHKSFGQFVEDSQSGDGEGPGQGEIYEAGFLAGVAYCGRTSVPLVACPVCGGEAIDHQDILARIRIAPA